MAQLVVLFPAQQNAGENVVNFAVFGIRQANYHLGKKVWIQVKIDVLLSVFSGIKQLRAAALLELQIEQNDISRIKIIRRQLKKNIVSLLKRFVFSQAIVQIHFHSDYLFTHVGHVLQQWTKEVKQSLGNTLP